MSREGSFDFTEAPVQRTVKLSRTEVEEVTLEDVGDEDVIGVPIRPPQPGREREHRRHHKSSSSSSRKHKKHHRSPETDNISSNRSRRPYHEEQQSRDQRNWNNDSWRSWNAAGGRDREQDLRMRLQQRHEQRRGGGGGRDVQQGMRNKPRDLLQSGGDRNRTRSPHEGSANSKQRWMPSIAKLKQKAPDSGEDEGRKRRKKERKERERSLEEETKENGTDKTAEPEQVEDAKAQPAETTTEKTDEPLYSSSGELTDSDAPIDSDEDDSLSDMGSLSIPSDADSETIRELKEEHRRKKKSEQKRAGGKYSKFESSGEEEESHERMEDEAGRSEGEEQEQMESEAGPSDQPTPIDDPISRLPVYYPSMSGCRDVLEFEHLNKIEEGTYGVVYRGQDKRTDELVALKRLKMEKEREGFPITSLREINTLLKAQHENIVTVREIVVGSNMDKIYIVMDFVEHDLKSLMETMKHPFAIGEVKTLMIQLLRGIHHMHDNWILHRDLKTSNLLLSHKGILKIGDFGLAREYGDPLKKYTPIVVTLWYRAPELLLGIKEYSTHIDMWSAGCILGEFLQKKPLFPGKGEIDQLNKIYKDLGTPNEKIWPGYKQLPLVEKLALTAFADVPNTNQLRGRFGAQLTDLGYDLMCKLLTYDPSERASAENAVKHSWFTEAPKPTPSDLFPTWPAKSERMRHNPTAPKAPHSPKPPSGGAQFYNALDRMRVSMAELPNTQNGADGASTSTPRGAQLIEEMLRDAGIAEYEPRVVEQLLDFAGKYVADVVEEAQSYSNYAGKKTIDMEDVQLAIKMRREHSVGEQPPRELLMELSHERNAEPLPTIKPTSGLRLPPDRFCLLQPNFRLRSSKQVLLAQPQIRPSAQSGLSAYTRFSMRAPTTYQRGPAPLPATSQPPMKRFRPDSFAHPGPRPSGQPPPPPQGGAKPMFRIVTAPESSLPDDSRFSDLNENYDETDD